MKKVTLYIILSLGFVAARGQSIDFAAVVSFSYSGETLEQVLDDLTARYKIRFSYSRQVLPLDMRFNVVVDAEPFAEALNILFEDTPVIYGFIADQIVLSVDPDYVYPLVLESGSARDGMDAEEMLSNGPREFVALPVGIASNSWNFNRAPENSELLEGNRNLILSEQRRLMAEAERQATAMNAQISLFTPVELSTKSNIYKPVNFSVNLLWGVHNSLDGFEMGGLANIIENDAQGVQMCGFYNGVGGSMRGAQFSGLINTVGARADGIQMTTLVNTAGGGKLVQFSGISNIARERAFGQATGLVNVGGDVDYLQLAGLMNIGKNVGVQIGLINIAESSKTSIGLFSFVKNGYRSLEIAGEEALHANLNFRMGVRSFYNIIHLGTNIDFNAWSVGYGIGTSIRTGKRHFLQLEVMTRQVNEDNDWTESLNLINQFNFFWDVRLGSQARVVFGPTFNVSTSRLYNRDTNTYGIGVAPSWTFYDETVTDNNNEQLNVKMWMGFHVGVRLNSREPLNDLVQNMN